MPQAAKLTLLALYAKESAVSLPANDPDIVAALDAYNAKYFKRSSKRLKDQRAETLAGLSWPARVAPEPRGCCPCTLQRL